jgi:dTDP-4-dehydrorhamnose 3,5-epimerase
VKITDTPIQGLKVIELPLFRDERGFFSERFSAPRFIEHELPSSFVQDNHSRSKPGVIRGLHYQHSPAQGKLVGVIRGRVWDVAVDIRPDSPTYGKYHGVELSGDNGVLFWMPPGFAHGFCVLGEEEADMLYKVTAPYNSAGEGGIRFDDPELAIAWPVKTSIVSDRDKGLMSFGDYKKQPVDWNRL